MIVFMYGDPTSSNIDVKNNVFVHGKDFKYLEDVQVSMPFTIGIGGMIFNPEFYRIASEKINDETGIIYGDFVHTQSGCDVVRLNNSYRMLDSCIPFVGSVFSPSFFYQIAESFRQLKTLDVSTKVDPSLGMFEFCCPQHWPGVAFKI